ncbi:MAG: YraN family protein [Rhodocyclaceae bacterium]|jgi:putative endonuclease|nr:YraN family protein [Rhodocyclaceae bacterium]
MAGWLDGWRKRIVGGGPAPAQDRAGAGARAEDLAARMLSSRGLTVVARNVRCRGGEVDLICLEGVSLVFVEVRLRSRQDFGGAAASIDRRKQGRVILAARTWLAGPGRAHGHRPCRFDAVLLTDPEGRRMEWLRGAFEADA